MSFEESELFRAWNCERIRLMSTRLAIEGRLHVAQDPINLRMLQALLPLQEGLEALCADVRPTEHDPQCVAGQQIRSLEQSVQTHHIVVEHWVERCDPYDHLSDESDSYHRSEDGDTSNEVHNGDSSSETEPTQDNESDHSPAPPPAL